MMQWCICMMHDVKYLASFRCQCVVVTLHSVWSLPRNCVLSLFATYRFLREVLLGTVSPQAHEDPSYQPLDAAIATEFKVPCVLPVILSLPTEPEVPGVHLFSISEAKFKLIHHLPDNFKGWFQNFEFPFRFHLFWVSDADIFYIFYFVSWM